MYSKTRYPYDDTCKSTTPAIAYRHLILQVIKGGFPHSEIPGSKLIRSSPKLIAAYHVLHRLCMPRHPPNALKTLDRSHCQCPSVQTVTGDYSGSRQLGKPGAGKDQFHEICPVACGQATQTYGRRVAPRRPRSGWNRYPNKSSLYDVIWNRRRARMHGANLFSLTETSGHLTPGDWWSRTGSNRRPPACKAGALPAELRPQTARHTQQPSVSNLRKQRFGGPG